MKTIEHQPTVATPPTSAGLDTRKRLYRTSRWQKTRLRQLREQPMCARCREAGRFTLADTVHHAEGHGDGWRHRFWTGPFESLCASCHSKEER